MQVIAQTRDSALLYHTRPEREGTAAFECGGALSMDELVTDDDGQLVGRCPGCGVQVFWPVNGGTDAQRLHAHHRLRDPKHPADSLTAAVESVLADATVKGGFGSVELALETLRALGEAGEPADVDTRTHPQLAAIKDELDERAQLEVERQRIVAEEVAVQAALAEIAELIAAEQQAAAQAEMAAFHAAIAKIHDQLAEAIATGTAAAEAAETAAVADRDEPTAP